MKKMNIKITALLAAFVLLFNTPIFAEGKKDLGINGSYYKQLVQMKDVVADILPPPAYIIEAYLTVLRIVDEMEKGMADGALDDAEKKTINEFIDYGNKLKDGAPGLFPGYFERIDHWAKDLSEATPEDKQLKDWLVSKSVEPAKQFFDIRDNKFNALAKAGDVKGAKKIVRDELKKAYQAHRNAIDVVVSRSRTVNAKIEKEVADKLTAAGGEVTDDVLIKSPLYTKVIQMKDVVSDILPPPAYIIESYLTVLQLIDETEIALTDGTIDGREKAEINRLIEWGRQLKEGASAKDELPGYFERQGFWTTDLSDSTPEEKNIKELMIYLSADPAKKFFEIRDSKFIPLIQGNDVEGSKKVAREELLPLYNDHRKHIDSLVIAANKRYETVEKQVNSLLTQ